MLRKICNIFCMLVCLLLLAACASGPDIQSDYDPEVDFSQYTQGTVNVDLVDLAEKRLVWEGVAIGKVKEGRGNTELRAAIDSGVTEMFTGYPFQAGQ
jgi:hypothetical protein